MASSEITIGYTNWRGEYAERRIIPRYVWFGATEWHPEEQWLLRAFDVGKGAVRDFALADIGRRTIPEPARPAGQVSVYGVADINGVLVKGDDVYDPRPPNSCAFGCRTVAECRRRPACNDPPGAF